ncbi:MAG TPA: SAM-dependent methyltransferase [Streptosporangiaceae bacterium]
MTDSRFRPNRSQGAPAEIDTSVASPARIYDYWLGGEDNFPADQEAAEQVIEVFPGIIPGVRANRAFLGRAVRYLAGEAGVRQFLDIGTGLPTANNTHEVAQEVAPESRIVYVDNDPIVLVQARALLASTPQGATNYIEADLRDPDKILQDAAATLDFSKPVAITLLMILMLIQDAEDPYGIVKRLLDAVPSGGYLVISHPAGDVDAGEIAEAYERLNERMGATQGTLRSYAEVGRFFDGLEMVEPGLVQLHRWRPAPGDAGLDRDVPAYAGVGRKP